ncbi:MAG TPA: hypothetical protein VGL83_04860 [Stellaceae bacterium]|jgi:hypothetical protein
MTTKRPRPAKDRPALRPEKLTKEAETLRSFARRARDPGTRQELEDMAERRALVAQAVEALVSDPPADDERVEKAAKPGHVKKP